MQKKKLITRRKAISAGLVSLGGLMLPGCSKTIPPSYGNILRMGDNFTYIAQRKLLPGQSMAKEYRYREISSFPATGTTNPADSGSRGYSQEGGPEYDEMRKNAFANWRLSIEGRVAKPGSYSLSDLQKFASRTQITRHTCEEGWTAIAQWDGVPLSIVLQNAGILPSARFVNFFAYDLFADSIDMLDALHPQTILAYGMNGRDLSIPHGAPIRLRVEKQAGYKSLKYLHRILVTDEFYDPGKLGLIRNGWSWHAGI